jgi:hypothetical protein
MSLVQLATIWIVLVRRELEIKWLIVDCNARYIQRGRPSWQGVKEEIFPRDSWKNGDKGQSFMGLILLIALSLTVHAVELFLF